MKGIILSGGLATRLHPATRCVSKQLLPVYDKPMIYYPLTTLMQAGIKDILVITNPEFCPAYNDLLMDGSQWGINIRVVTQDKPIGIAHAFLMAHQASFLDDEPVALILGDNLFHGNGLVTRLQEITNSKDHVGANLFLAHVQDPQRYGVAGFTKGVLTDIQEKPLQPASDWAVTGLYVYDRQILDIARQLKPSARGELEITDVNNVYVDANQCDYYCLGMGEAWLDMGTPDSLLDAAQYVQAIQRRQGVCPGCPEEAALRHGWLDSEKLRLFVKNCQTDYERYLHRLISPDGLFPLGKAS